MECVHVYYQALNFSFNLCILSQSLCILLCNNWEYVGNVMLCEIQYQSDIQNNQMSFDYFGWSTLQFHTCMQRNHLWWCGAPMLMTIVPTTLTYSFLVTKGRTIYVPTYYLTTKPLTHTRVSENHYLRMGVEKIYKYK